MKKTQLTRSIKAAKVTKHPYIHDHFINEHGDKVQPTDAVYQTMSNLLGKPKANRVLPSVQVVQEGSAFKITLGKSTAKTKPETWTLTLENGEERRGKITTGLKASTITLPKDLPLGYHNLTTNHSKLSCRIIVTPATAYQPKALQDKKKLWGAILQLYTLRSRTDWGIGDFGDLAEFMTRLAEKSGDFVGLNPIHALFPANPEGASPYSPSSRLWQNILYINVGAIEAFQQSEQGQAWFHSQAIQDEIYSAKMKNYVDYSQVMKLKLTGLRFAFEQFQQQDQTTFEAFIEKHGEALKIQGTFDALHQWLSDQFSEQWGWNDWAEEYQSYQSPAVKQFQQEQTELIRFYMWLQFIAQQQLSACNQIAKNLGMPIGFYRDLAVGVADNGAETWADKDLFVLGASVGAPPDIMAPQGQNWGLSPMHPEVLQQRGYQPFIDLLRANMQDCGALRIDHILGFARMWWVAKGETADKGLYVKYPLEDLLSILALESQRHECLIIAEALGTVPEGMLEALESRGILAYNIFYFEYEHGQSKALANYPYQAMTTLSTHDLPTVKGYWQSHDFDLGQQYGVYPNEEVLNMLKETRLRNKALIRQAVEQSGHTLAADSEEVGVEFTHQLQHYVADTNSALFGTQPEDWLNMLDPVNIPGTSNEYPNWRRKLSRSIQEIFDEPGIQGLLEGIRQKRQQE